MADFVSILVFMLVGLIAGWLADVVVPGIGFGLIGDMIVGIIGALIGGLLFGLAGFGGGGFGWSILVAFIGAVILLAIIKLIRRN